MTAKVCENEGVKTVGTVYSIEMVSENCLLNPNGLLLAMAKPYVACCSLCYWPAAAGVRPVTSSHSGTNGPKLSHKLKFVSRNIQIYAPSMERLKYYICNICTT